jgi:cell division protein FtsN
MPEPASASGSAPGSVEPSRRAAPSRKFGLEVATFIFEERARVERERLAAIGLHARVVTTLEYGSRVYRVVLGGYPHPAAAERAADSLLSNGVVLQARVVSVSY